MTTTKSYKLTSTIQSASDLTTVPLNSSGDACVEADFSVTPAGTNVAKPIAITQSQIKACVLLFTATGSTQGSVGGSCTLKTNSSGSPQDTITLVDGVPLVYAVGTTAAGTAFTLGTVPFSGNITEFYMTDGSTGSVGGILSIRCLTQQ